ncbi:MAG: class III signal peptide-containing protein [Raoultibacter sp.]
MNTVDSITRKFYCKLSVQVSKFKRDIRGQGTAEYAILVGVLVVIAILAITIFRPKIQELWDAIVEGINGL